MYFVTNNEVESVKISPQLTASTKGEIGWVTNLVIQIGSPRESK